MYKLIITIIIFFVQFASPAFAKNTNTAVYPKIKYIKFTAEETESYFYDAWPIGKDVSRPLPMKKDEAYFKLTFEMYPDGRVIRTEVVNTISGRAIADDTVYKIEHGLDSNTKGKKDPYKGDETFLYRAIGKPGSDSLEILMITNSYMQSVRSTGSYFIITRYKIVDFTNFEL